MDKNVAIATMTFMRIFGITFDLKLYKPVLFSLLMPVYYSWCLEFICASVAGVRMLANK